MSGAFAQAALQLRALDLVPIPCKGDEDDDGKTPGFKTANWKYPPGLKRYEQFVLRFLDENVGLLTEWSHLTVIDNDDPSLEGEIEYRFGRSPLIVGTPSDHTQRYFQSNGERCGTLRKSEGLAIDIKGIGGFVVCPPSIRPSGPHKGKLYRLLEGRWEDVKRLPYIKPGSLPGRPQKAASKVPERVEHPAPPINDGTRHIDLLSLAMQFARQAPDKATLRGNVHWANMRCVPILPGKDVEDIVDWAWKCQQEGRNFAGRGPLLITTHAEIEAFQVAPKGPDAFLLYGVLRKNHYGGEAFAISPRAMAQADVIHGWTEWRYREARSVLVNLLGRLVLVRHGGRGPRDPALFKFADADD
jgi:hypothetical protein